ncbi:MAG: alpha/beta hydrolase [Acidimicrobiaceae bacterium]|nr:alpha/beta hydrolase [Acidimicrobiaceae bacterium]
MSGDWTLDPDTVAALEVPETSDFWDVPGSRRLERLAGDASLATRREDPAVRWRDLSFDVAGRSIPIRLYEPVEHPSPRGAVAYFHGGGFVFGNLDNEHDRLVTWCRDSGALVMSVDYRRAPENPYPAGVEDCRESVRWMLEHADELGIDPNRWCVGGASAGGALAAAVAQWARDHVSPPPVAQILLYPVLDDRATEGSTRTYFEGLGWDGRRVEKMWELYLQGTPADPGAAPAREEYLAGLAPAYVLVCEHDPLRDEALDYARRLSDSGVEVELHVLPRAYHAVDVIAPESVLARRAMREQGDVLRHYVGPRR